MAHEVELKFRIPPARLPALRRAVETAAAERLGLAARYFDTPSGALAQAGVALRIRREGRRWVQTLKAQEAGTLRRLEHEVPVSAAAGRGPVPDLGRHAGTPAGERLAAVLATANEPLVEQYAVTMTRTRRAVALPGGVRVELALDEGEITCGAAAGRRRWPVCELEIELLAGAPAALPGVARRWAERHGLWLDTRSKAERGSLLTRGLTTAPPTGWRVPTLPRQCLPSAALAAMRAAALDAVLANASQVADGASQPEHLHQLRVNLRRLRSLLRLFGPADAARDARLARLFAQLGQARDADVLAADLWPRLAAAGAPALTWPPAEAAAIDVVALLRGAEWTTTMLGLLALNESETDAAADATSAQDLRAWLTPPLRRLQRQLQREAGQAAQLDQAGRHRLRKRLKRLRYALEAAASVLPQRAVKRWLQALRPALDALGAANDAAVAGQRCARLAAFDPHAYFAQGWLAREEEAQVALALRRLRRVARLPTL